MKLLILGGFISFYVIFSILAGKIAQDKERSFWRVWAVGMLFNPFIGIIVALALYQYKNCQFCAEYIKPEAIVCKHFHRDQAVEEVE